MRPKTFRGAVAVLVSVFLQCALPASAEGLDPAAIAAFSQQMSARYGFNAKSLTATLAQAQRRDTILTTIAKPAEHKPWYVYRPIFMTAERIDAGVRFWTDHAAVLARAEQEYGVPASIIVAIIGVETFYGRNTGNFRVIEALGTLAFHYPPRATFFRAELENFFLLARDENLDALTPTGSYAGAMGLPQFMPSSFRNFAVDFDHDGHRDIWRNTDDAIGSVANYLKKHGWVARQAIVMPVMPGTANAALASDKLELKRTAAQFMAAGVRTFDPVDPELPAVLIAYESKEGAEYWLGFKNFYAITRYNRSPKYALAVAQLADAMVNKRRPAAAAKQP